VQFGVEDARKTRKSGENLVFIANYLMNFVGMSVGVQD
jgi:hypothetical protein